MITKHLTILLLFLSASIAYGQKGKLTKPLEPVHGHYKYLSAISGSPKSPNEEIDKQKFPFDSASAARRLSLKPIYLVNTTLEDFKISAPPANSSTQTRAEIDYLLRLQAQRTKLDIESSLYIWLMFIITLG